jgi:hypothetical protein
MPCARRLTPTSLPCRDQFLPAPCSRCAPSFLPYCHSSFPFLYSIEVSRLGAPGGAGSRSSAMDLVETSGRRPSGRGGKGRKGNRLGLKKPVPLPPQSSSPVLPPPPSSLPTPPQTSLLAPPTSLPASSPASLPVPPPPISTIAVPTSSPDASTSSVLPWPPQGARWGGSIPPNLQSLHGNQQAPNSW